MPYEPTIRTYTSHQHGSGVSVDGILLDRTMEDYLQRHMHIPRGDIASRYMPQQYVLGFEPPYDDSSAVPVEDRPATKLPFMRVNNSQHDVDGFETYEQHGENPWRHKGHNVTIIDPTRLDPADQKTDQFAWTTSLAFPEPSIVDEICLVLETGPAGRVPYENLFLYGVPAGPLTSPATQITFAAPIGVTDWVSDIVIQMQVDSDLGRNNAELSDLEVNLFDWRADGRRFSDVTVTTDTTLPSMPNGWVGGPGPNESLLIKLSRLNVPLPAGARVRFSLIIPWYDTSVYEVSHSWNDRPWARQIYSLSLTTLELLR